MFISPTLFRSGILFPFEFNFLLWFLVLLAHKDRIAYKHQRKIAAFICLNLNLYVFLIHAIEGIKIEREGELYASYF